MTSFYLKLHMKYSQYYENWNEYILSWHLFLSKGVQFPVSRCAVQWNRCIKCLPFTRDAICMLTRNESANNYQYTLTVTIPKNHIHSDKKIKLENAFSLYSFINIFLIWWFSKKITWQCFRCILQMHVNSNRNYCAVKYVTTLLVF